MTTTTTMMVPASAHTAGIYADPSMDGPEIGTLVAVIDRAKNLPNRKSMGKQDPYCAARLGKEAKKTETDRRGGQTPRWDQELRFTVHDSPDFYRLKISVFNDDKKTELIGEAWLSLEDIVVRGGGRSDQWHQLNCKGRYAGDIRIEMTYYDIRPRQSKSEGRQQPIPVDDVQGPSKEGLSGPRQPRPVKRRPLPANPSQAPSPELGNHTSSPMHSTLSNRQTANGSPQYPAYNPHDRRIYDYEAEQLPSDMSLKCNSFDQQELFHNQYYDEPPMPQGTSSGRSPAIPYHSTGTNLHFHDSNHHTSPNHVMQHSDYDRHLERSSEEASPFSSMSNTVTPQQPLYRPQPLRPQNENYMSRPHAHTPDSASGPHRSMAEQGVLHAARSEDVLNQHRQRFWDAPEDLHNVDAEDPPLPPVHRNSSSTTTTQSGFIDHRIHSKSASSTPSHMRHGQFGTSGSPLAQVHHVDETQASPGLPLPQRIETVPRAQATGYGPVPTQKHRSSVPLPGSRVQYTPSSLVAGFRSQAAGEAALRSSQETENHSNANNRYARGSNSSFPVYDAPPAAAPAVGGERGSRPHRNSVPAFNNSVTNSDPHTRRKAVSPQPDATNSERRHSDLPFSPDSFDAFNPNLTSSQLGNQDGARYTTPEQARETAIQSERDAKRGDEPIIGDDGRIIDPSDHLPADTWAPEPTPKGPKKGPEVTLRFRQGPVQSTPLPRATRPTLAEARPNVITNTPTQTQSAETSPTVAGRARLQKKSRAAMTQPQPYSSPAVPTLDHTPHSKPPHLPRHYASDYPLRERDNSPYVNSNGPSPWQRSAANGAPPPVPEKLPIHRGQEEWGNTNALSEEMRSIDIGVAPQGGHRARARRYGF